MTQIQYLLAVSIFVIVMCVKSSNAVIKCYQCNSYDDKRCSDNDIEKYKSELEKECPTQKPIGSPDGTQYKLCRKIKQVVDFEVNGLQPDSRTIRTCGWDDSTYSNRCYQRSGFGGRQEVCACDNDGCNGSSKFYSSVLAILTGLIVVHVLNL